MVRRGDPELYRILEELQIGFDYYEHPPVPTVEEAALYWKDIDAGHCKNLFFRNHKGNRHFLVVFEHTAILNIRDLEQRLKQGKISFASPARLMNYLKLEPGSVSPFGLIHDADNHVKLFIDENLRMYERVSFHPNLNTASLVLTLADFCRFLDWKGVGYEFTSLY